MILTTATSIENKSICSYLGVVQGTSIEFTSHSLGSFSSSSVKRDASRAIKDAVSNMKRNAPSGADAIIGIEVNTSITYIGDGAGTLTCLATATGTAVRLEDTNACRTDEASYVLPEL